MTLVFGKIVDETKKTVYTVAENHKQKIRYIHAEDTTDNFNEFKKQILKDGFLPLVVLNEKPVIEEGFELQYKMTMEKDALTKEYSKKPLNEALPEDKNWPRQFSKLKIYVAFTKMNAWQILQDWLLHTDTQEGVNLKIAFDLAQDISEDYPGFNEYFAKIKEMLQLSDEDAERLLEDCKL